MKKVIVGLAAAFFCLFGNSVMSFASGVVWEDIGRGILNIRSVLIDSNNPGVIYIGTSNGGVFKSEDKGESWRNILSVRGENNSTNYLISSPGNKNSLYAATGNGLIFSPDSGKRWNKIFQGKNSLENECTALGILPYAIFLGTKAGLFVSQDNGRSWHKETGKPGNSAVLAIAFSLREPNYIYIACVGGVFKSKDSGKSWERIFVFFPTEDGNDTEEINYDRDEAERDSCVRYISIDPNNLNYLYLATARGIYRSQDRGSTWYMLPDYGLLSRDAESLLLSNKSDIYAVTKSGVFEYGHERWQELSFGLVTDDIRFLTIDIQGNLYVACDKGLFKASMPNINNSNQSNAMTLYAKDEPKIKDVQEAAIHYAEVESEKIKEWRKRAKMKAILPRLTFGLDRSENTNYEIYTSATTRYDYQGPNDKSTGWDVTLCWELGDIIWNESQTSIDVRSRLMVELRDDILDEVNKLYFERLRVKMELDNFSIEDRKKRFEKELRLEELTASLDALTGGYFSQQMNNTKPTG